jgi:hypothetical protein
MTVIRIIAWGPLFQRLDKITDADGMYVHNRWNHRNKL